MGGGNSKVNKVVPQVEHIVPYVDCFNEYSRQTITLRPSNNILEDFPVLDENPNGTDDAMQCLIENLEMKNMIVNVLVNVFQEIISNNVLESLLKHMMPVRHTKGSIILSRGDINDTFYIVIEGAVTSNNKWNGSANKEMNDIDMSNETIDLSDTILSSGMTFGRLGLLLDAPSSSTVIASSEETCVLLKLERKIFRHFQKLIVLEAYIGRCLRLSSVAEFANLRNDKLAAIASVMKTKFINAGEYIYSHKEMSDKLVVVEKGFAILEIMEDVPVSPYKGNNGQAMGGSNVNHCRSMDDEEEDERVPFYRELSGPLPTPAADEATNAASNPNSESDPTAPSRFTKKFDEMTAEEQMDLYGFSRPPTMSDNTKQSLLATSLANLRSNTTPMPAAETPRANDPVDTGIVSANDSRSLNEKRILYEGCVVGSNILKGRAKLPGGWLYTSRSAAASAHDPSQPFSFGSVTPFDMIAIGDGCWISYISVDMIEHKLGALSAALRKCNTSSNLKDPKRDFKWNITGTAYSISPATTPRTVQNHTETEVDVGSTDVESRRDTAQEVPDSHWFRVIENNDYIRFIKSGSNGLTKVYSCMNAHVFGNTYGNMPITGNMNNSNRGLRNEDNESVSQSLRLGEGKFNVPATLSLRLSPNARYTLKMYDKTAVVRENAFQMPLNEVYYLFSLDNTFIAKGRAYFQTLNSLCIATESVCYGSVFNLLYHDERYEDLFGNGIPLDVIQFYLSNIILALSYFHSKGLVYRNLKPENLLIGQDGYLKLIGLELVRKLPYCVDEVCFHKTFTQCGTLGRCGVWFVFCLFFSFVRFDA